MTLVGSISQSHSCITFWCGQFKLYWSPTHHSTSILHWTVLLNRICRYNFICFSSNYVYSHLALLFKLIYFSEFIYWNLLISCIWENIHGPSYKESQEDRSPYHLIGKKIKMYTGKNPLLYLLTCIEGVLKKKFMNLSFLLL